MEKKYTLKKNKEFRFVYSKGKSAATPALVLLFVKNKWGPKVGFSVSNKMGNAVVRNRTKRLLRESFRTFLPQMEQECSYVFIARSKLVGLSLESVKSAMQEVLSMAGKLRQL